MPRTVLFLCTGNYYRSRFAELLFNFLASREEQGWTSFSRGIALEFGIHNVGAISHYALQGLKARGIQVQQETRFPMPLQERDLTEADLIIALNEAEHRPFLETRFPEWVERVEFWHISDLDAESADKALSRIERKVRSLIGRLARDPV